jgi:hypothetical protein
VAEVVSDSYGAAKQQHTFTLRVVECQGYDPLPVGTQIMRKGRNVYRNGTERQQWDDEAARDAVLREKHQRGARAREIRAKRRENSTIYDY